MIKRILVFLMVIIPFLSFSQGDGSFGIKWAGFVKSELIFDSRQSVAARQGQFYLYPKNILPDADGNDINAKSILQMFSIQSRLKLMITAQDVLGAKTSGLIEGAFFGNIEPNINSFRLRHAFVKLAWPNTELLVGQYWHPMFITKCFPGTVSFNTGVPFQPFSRNPQIRISQDLGKFKIIFAVISQIDFVSSGPDGPRAKYLRNTVLPESNLRFEYLSQFKEGHEFYMGVGGNYLSLTPRLQTETNYKTDQTIGGFSGMAYLKVKTPKASFKFEGVYGQNLYSLLMLGGYAVHGITDWKKDFREYTPVKTLSLWTDIHSNGKFWQVGLFAGYTKNLGSEESIMAFEPLIDKMTSEDNLIYSRGSDIEYVYRISPRLIYNPGRVRFAGEIEYTVAAYGQPNFNGEVQNSEQVGNLRFLLATYIFF
jgi:hypothetical protein